MGRALARYEGVWVVTTFHHLSRTLFRIWRRISQGGGNMSPGIQVCEGQSKYWVSIAEWIECRHGTLEARGSSTD